MYEQGMGQDRIEGSVFKAQGIHVSLLEGHIRQTPLDRPLTGNRQSTLIHIDTHDLAGRDLLGQVKGNGTDPTAAIQDGETWPQVRQKEAYPLCGTAHADRRGLASGSTD